MTRHDFFMKELSKLLLIKEEEVEEFIKRYTYFLKKEQQKGGNLTKALTARGLVVILKDIKRKREENKKKNIFKNIKHKCLIKHKEKFLELANLGLGCKAISKYFKENLHCNISHTTIQKALNILKELENG
jgi:hypothetical protein